MLSVWELFTWQEPVWSGFYCHSLLLLPCLGSNYDEDTHEILDPKSTPVSVRQKAAASLYLKGAAKRCRRQYVSLTIWRAGACQIKQEVGALLGPVPVGGWVGHSA